MGDIEITNAQYALFDPEHDTRYTTCTAGPGGARLDRQSPR